MKGYFFYYLVLFSIGGVILNGCSLVEQKMPKTALPEQQIEFEPVPSVWQARGRIAITNESENWHASFVWKQKQNDYSLRFSGPLGQTQLQIEHLAGNSEKLPQNRIVVGNERFENNTSMQHLLVQYSPISIPLDALKYWFFGQAEPYSQAIFSKNVKGHIVSLQQQGWTILFKKYQVNDKSYYPTKINAEKQQHKIKVFIRSREIQE